MKKYNKKNQVNKKGYLLDSQLQSVHRSVYIAFHGSIHPGWVVHHIDCVKLNNDLSNLIALPEKCHNMLHQVMYKSKCIYNRKETENYLNHFLENIQHVLERLEKLDKQLALLTERRAKVVYFLEKQKFLKVLA